MPIDCFASEPHFADHLAPIYALLDDPGDFIVGLPMIQRTTSRWPFAQERIADPTRPVLVASHGDVKRMRRQGRTKIAYIEHGIGQSYGTGHGSYAGGRERDDVSLFMTPNQYSADLWKAAYPTAQVEVIGSPHLDSLPQRHAGPGPTVAISFHWNCALVPETMGTTSYFRPILPELAQHYNLLGHCHPRAIPIVQRYYRRVGIPLIEDFADICRKADLYICDNSSSMYEFAATGRPVVVLNAPTYRRQVHHGLRFWEAADVGIQVDSPAELLDAVELALTDPPAVKAKREAALDIVYAYRAGASQRAADLLRVWMQEPLRSAA